MKAEALVEWREKEGNEKSFLIGVLPLIWRCTNKLNVPQITPIKSDEAEITTT